MKEKGIITEDKKKVVDEFKALIKEYPIVGAVDMDNLPAKQLQNMREQLRGKVVIRMTKRRLIRIALQEVAKEKKGIDGLVPKLEGLTALLFTKDNPFALYKVLDKNKAPAPAKAGQIAPKNIVVPAGPTGFSPGPIIGELGSFKIKAGIEAGKVAIKEDCIVASKGDKISPALAGILTRLGIEPMEVGLRLTAVYENGTIYDPEVLKIDDAEFKRKIQKSYMDSLSLSLSLGIANKDNIDLLIGKAFKDARGVAVEAGIFNNETTNMILGKADNTASNLKKQLNV